jgi:hypothetical protein
MGGKGMRGLATKTLGLILFARSPLEEFHPMKLRQMHYAIFSAAKISYENTQADYKWQTPKGCARSNRPSPLDSS